MYEMPTSPFSFSIPAVRALFDLYAFQRLLFSLESSSKVTAAFTVYSYSLLTLCTGRHYLIIYSTVLQHKRPIINGHTARHIQTLHTNEQIIIQWAHTGNGFYAQCRCECEYSGGGERTLGSENLHENL